MNTLGCHGCSNYKREEEPDKNRHLNAAIAELEIEARDEIHKLSPDYVRLEMLCREIQQLKALLR